MNLYRLVYYSRNSELDAKAETEAKIESILQSARRNNPLLGLTGALIFNSGVFAQVLEGRREDIETMFERIQRDGRHRDVQVLAFDALQERGFPDWSMAFVGRSVEDQTLFSHVGTVTGFEEQRLEGEHVLRIIKSIAFEEELIRTP